MATVSTTNRVAVPTAAQELSLETLSPSLRKSLQTLDGNGDGKLSAAEAQNQLVNLKRLGLGEKVERSITESIKETIKESKGKLSAADVSAIQMLTKAPEQAPSFRLPNGTELPTAVGERFQALASALSSSDSKAAKELISNLLGNSSDSLKVADLGKIAGTTGVKEFVNKGVATTAPSGAAAAAGETPSWVAKTDKVLSFVGNVCTVASFIPVVGQVAAVVGVAAKLVNFGIKKIWGKKKHAAPAAHAEDKDDHSEGGGNTVAKTAETVTKVAETVKTGKTVVGYAKTVVGVVKNFF